MSSSILLDNLLAYSLQVALLAGAAGLLPRLLRIRLPAFLLAYWQLVLAACLALPLLQTWQPVDTLPKTLSTFAESAALSDFEALGGPNGVQPAALSWQGWALSLLLTGAGLRLAWLALGLWRLRRLCRKARRLEATPAQAELFCRQFGIRPAFYLSSQLGTPATFGLFRPRVILPPAFESMQSALQRSLLCHEMLHLKRRDWAFVLAEEAVKCLLWFHPAIWWLTSRIRLAREQAVDREVVRRTRQRKDYLDLLLAAAESQLAARAAPAPSFFRTEHLSERVASLIQEVSMSRKKLFQSAFVIIGLLMPVGQLALRAFPMKSPAPAAQQPQAPQREPIKVGGSVMAEKLMERVVPEFPEEALEARVQGVVFLSVTINEAGEVWKAEVMRGHPLLNQAAREAVRQWRYQPVLLNGEPVPAQTTVTVHFRLPDGEGDGGAGLVREATQDSRSRFTIDPDGTIWYGDRQVEDVDLDKLAEGLKRAIIYKHPDAPNEALRRITERFSSALVMVAPRKQSSSILLVEFDRSTLQSRLNANPGAAVFRAYLDGNGKVLGLEYESGPDEPEIYDLALAQLRAYLSRQKSYKQPAVSLQATELFVALVQRP